MAGWFVTLTLAAVPASYGEAPNSVFTALGIEPAKFARMWIDGQERSQPSFISGQFDSDPDPFAMAVLPTTPTERQQVLDTMMAEPRHLSATQHLFITLLLEGWGRTDDALNWLERQGAPTVDPYHLVRLRYRTGNLEGAAAAWVAAQDPDRPEEYGFQVQYRRSAALVRPFVALDQFPELAKFLEWLQPRCQSTSLRGDILKLRLNVAYAKDKTAGLLDQLQRESPVLRQAADWLLTHDPSKLPQAMSDMPPGDILLFHQVAREVPAVTAAIRKLVADGRGSAGEHTDLFLQLFESFSLAEKGLLEEWMTHDETCLRVLTANLGRLMTPGISNLPKAPLAALAERHPDHPAINLVAGMALFDDSHPASVTTEGTTAPSNKFLQRAMLAPLLVDTTGEFSSFKPFIPQTPVDIVGRALTALTETVEPRSLLAGLTDHAGFGDLPARERARYLAIAKLDIPFIEALLTLDWSDPANDRCGDWLGRYFKSITERKPPAGALWERMVAAMPAMLAGSKDKSESRIERDIISLRYLLSKIDPAATTFTTVLAGLSGRLDGSARAMVERVAVTGRNEPRVKRTEWTRNPQQAHPLGSLAWFTPASLMRWVDVGLSREAIHACLSRNRDPRSQMAVMGLRFPVLASREFHPFPMQPQDLECLWKLRRLLPDDSPHAVACDLAIALKQLPPPADDLAAIAQRHADAVMKNPQELDFILLKAFTTMQPGQQPDWSGMAALATAPAVVRMQAAAAMTPFTARDSHLPRLGDLKIQLQQGILMQQDSPPDRKEEDAAYDNLKRLEQLGKQAEPEARELARKVLRAFVARGARNTTPTENIAIANLVKTGGFDPFLKEIAAQCLAQPGGELASAKAMHALHQYAIVHSHGEAAAFAKQVLELDPDDVPAASDCASAALTAHDPAGLMAALPALRKGDPPQFLAVLASEQALSILTKDAVPRLLEILAMSPSPGPENAEHGGYRMSDIPQQRLEALHQFFDQAGQEVGARFRSLILATGWLHPGAIIPALVKGLSLPERRQEAVDLLVSVIKGESQPQPAAPSLRFQDAVKQPFQWSSKQHATFNSAVSAKICKELLEQLQASALEIPSDMRALLSYAATPTPEVFSAELLPMLVSLARIDRNQAAQYLDTMLKQVPGAEERHRLLEDAVAAANPHPADPAELVKRANRCVAPGDLAKLRDLWRQLQVLLPGELIRKEWTLSPMIEPMARVADDPLWSEYSAELLATIPQSKNLIYLTRHLPSLARPSLMRRLSPVLRALATACSGKMDNRESIIRSIVLAAWLLDDSATLDLLDQQFRLLPAKQFSPQIGALLMDLRLRAGDPEAALPMLWARPGPDGQWTIQWSMAGVLTDRGSGRTCLGVDPKALDGVFDLTILAGPDANRFKQLTTITAAKGSGTLDLTLPENTTTLSLTATNPATKAVLHAPPLALSAAKPPAFVMAPPPTAADLEVRKLASPWGQAEAVVGIGLSPGRVTEITSLPWQPGQTLELRAWVLSSGRTRLIVQPLDDDGKPLAAIGVGGFGGYELLPRWQWLHFTLSPPHAATAAKLVLAATCDATQGPQETLPAIWLTDCRLATAVENPPPAGAERVGRIPGDISAMSCDPAGERIAAGLRDGRVIVLDIKTARHKDFNPCPATSIHFIGIGGQRVIAVDTSGMVHSMNLDSGQTTKLGRLDIPMMDGYSPTLALSPDGQWLAWTGMMVDVLVARLGIERIEPPLSLPVGQSPEFMMDVGGGAILASGSSQHFRVPLAELPTLDPGKLAALTEAPLPKSAVRVNFRDNPYWLDPLHALRITGHVGESIFSAERRTLALPAPTSSLTVTPQGIAFYATPQGLIYRLDPTAVNGYTPMKKILNSKH